MTLSLTIEGEVYEGWTDASVTRSLEEFCPTFSLTYVDRWLVGGGWPILQGQECQLRYKRDVLITGYLNSVRWDIRGDQHSVSADGRAKTQDLVDCSATHSSGQWRNRTLTQIATELCSPFGLSVDYGAGADSDKFKHFALEEGESVFDTLDRMCKLRGILPVTTVDGNVSLIRTEQNDREITIDMSTVITRQLETDDQNRYSEYRLRAQAPGDEEHGGAAVTAQSAAAADEGVRRFRPLVIVGHSPGHRRELEAQAKYERNIRAGQSAQLYYTIPGFQAPDGKPWEPGMRCIVRDRQLLTNRTLIVSTVEHAASASAETTRLKLVKPEAFTTQNYPND